MTKLNRYLMFSLFVSCAVGGIAVWSQVVMRTGKMRVESSVENLRKEPGGQQFGTILKDSEVELIAQEGNWVRVKIDGWIWGPSLEGFVEEDLKTKSDDKVVESVDPLIELVPRVRRLVNEGLGKFYGVNKDDDLRLLRIRFRVGDIGLDRLLSRQCKLTLAVWDWIGTDIDVDAVRVESNFPNGNGTVGMVIAEISVKKLNQVVDRSAQEWIRYAQFSSDEGKTWSDDLKLD